MTKLLFVQATKVNCPGATAEGENVLAFNNVTGACDWAVNVPGCGGVRCCSHSDRYLSVENKVNKLIAGKENAIA